MAFFDFIKKAGEKIKQEAKLLPSTFKFLPGEISKIVYKTKSYIPGGELAKGLGETAARFSSQVKRADEQVKANQEQLHNLLIKEIQDSKGDQEKINRLAKIAKQTRIAGPLEATLEGATTGMQMIASGAELALLAATGLKRKLPMGATGKLVPQTAIKALQSAQAAKTAAALKGAGIVKKLAVKVAKPLLKESLIGAGFFGAAKAAEKDAKINDIVKSAEMGAVISGGITLGAIGAGAAISRAAEFLGPKISKGLQKAEMGLEKIAAGKPTAIKTGTQLEKILSFIGEGKATFKQKAAQIILKGGQEVSKLKARFIDRFSPLQRVEKKIGFMADRPLKESEKVYRNARLANAIADAKAEQLVGKYISQINQFGDDITLKSKAYLTQLDLIDRAKLGQKVAGGQSLDDLINGLEKLTREIGGDDMKKVGELRQITRNYHKSLLDERVAAGLLNQDQVNKLLETHPNYIPHNVLMDIDEQAVKYLSNSLNVPKTDIMKAVGSVRNIDDPFVATIQRTPIATRIIEKNKVLKGLVEAQEELNLFEGMRPIQTAERVLTQQEISILKKSSNFFDLPEQQRNLVLNTIEKGLDNSLGKFKPDIINQLDDISKELGIKLEIKGRGGNALRGFFKYRSAEGNLHYSEKIRLNPKQGGVQQFTTAHEIGHKINASLEEGTSQTLLRTLRNELEAPGKTILRDELKKVSYEIRPMQINPSQYYKNYRNSSSELFADYISVYLVDPQIALQKAPKFTEFFNNALDKNPAIKNNINNLFKFIKKIPQKQNTKLFTEVDLDEIVKNFNKIKDSKNFEQAIKNIKVSENLKPFLQELYSGLEKIKPLKSGEYSINLFRQGIKETWIVPEDIAVAIKNLDAPITPGWWKLLTAPQTLLKKSATQYNLSFALPNKFRDQQTALITADSFIQELAKRTGVSPQAVNLTQKEIKELYKISGGYGGSIFREGDDKIFNQLSKVGIKKQSQYLNPIKTIEAINESLEQSTRMQVFRKGLEAGLSPKDAAFVSRDATIDFAKMGTWMRPINQAVPFLNARVQGFINLPKALIKNPEVFARMQMYTAVYPTLALHQNNRRFESYKNISQYYKDKYWIIMTGENQAVDEYSGEPMLVPQFITIPKGEGQTLVSGPVQYYLDKADGIDFRKTSEMLADVLGSASPLEFQTWGEGNLWLTGISQLGPLASIAVGLGTNIQPYSGQKIVPESRKQAPKEMQFKKTTPETTKEIANILNVAPANVEFILNSFGGVPQDAQRAADIVYGVVKDGKIGGNALTETPFGAATQIPISRRFTRESSPSYSPETQFREKQKEELETEITGKKLQIKDKAEQIFTEMNKRKTKDERVQYLNSFGDELTPEIQKKIKSLKDSRQSVEVLKKNDSVELRARYILQRLDEQKEQGIAKEDRIKFLDDLEENGILTSAVKEMIAKLKNQ